LVCHSSVLVGGWLVGYLVKTRSPLKRSSTLKAIDLLKQFMTSVWETKFSVTVAPVWVVWISVNFIVLIRLWLVGQSSAFARAVNRLSVRLHY
jgi:hypothetical protein